MVVTLSISKVASKNLVHNLPYSHYSRQSWGNLFALGSNYELFNCNNFNICYRSWNYRGCWHQAFPPIVTCSIVWGELIPIVDPLRESTSLLIVTTSPFWHWVICAPAAFLRSGSHLSGSLSGIKPQSSVTRRCLGRPIEYQHGWWVGRPYKSSL